jgi:hypothetical protein
MEGAIAAGSAQGHRAQTRIQVALMITHAALVNPVSLGGHDHED